MKIPNAEHAVVAISKLHDYCLSPIHDEGKHKARLFKRTLGMTEIIKLLDIVALTVDLPEYKLWHGQVGTVVEILAGGKAFEVEFCDREGRTYESVGLRPDQIMVLHYDPVEVNSKSA